MRDAIATDTISDKEIIGRILSGEKNLYAIIIRRYNQRLYRVGMSIINDDAEVEDIMQVAYINAWENLDKFAFKASFSTWLTRILINESLLRLKKRGRSINMNDDTMDKEIYQQQTATVRTPVGQMLNTELKVILEEAIRNLPDKYRIVFIMREIEGLNVAETQECLDLSEANVKVRLNRAKALLKESLNGYYKKEDILHFHLSRCDRMIERVMNQIAVS
ncbi:RNA polymerase sigma factor [Terrimonas pollutisoli]|uniref:RNA polymerase sigma factor n=1 Tax=Terrimonas pollutisoli TaxID=3034147 RepID=UPI0023EAF09C|nr:RNA polymerase sigma factor [Terrimonas sp. H1YJ31]